MPSVEISKLQGIGPTRAVSDSDFAPIDPRPAASPPTGPKPGITVEVGTGAASDPASPPVDPERVEQIRAALRDGSYPLVPTTIADALIAAQVSFAIVPQAEQ